MDSCYCHSNNLPSLWLVTKEPLGKLIVLKHFIKMASHDPCVLILSSCKLRIGVLKLGLGIQPLVQAMHVLFLGVVVFLGFFLMDFMFLYLGA